MIPGAQRMVSLLIFDSDGRYRSYTNACILRCKLLPALGGLCTKLSLREGGRRGLSCSHRSLFSSSHLSSHTKLICFELLQVVGHTIQGRGINSACDAKVHRIDVGMSIGCGNSAPQVLFRTSCFSVGLICLVA